MFLITDTFQHGITGRYFYNFLRDGFAYYGYYACVQKLYMGFIHIRENFAVSILAVCKLLKHMLNFVRVIINPF